jgi:hypothetical protein
VDRRKPVGAAVSPGRRAQAVERNRHDPGVTSTISSMDSRPTQLDPGKQPDT